MFIPANFRKLSGLVELGRHTPDELRETCRAMRAAGFVDVYLGDLF